MRYHVKLEAMDLWRYSVYNMIHSKQGMFNIFIAVIMVALLFLRWGWLSTNLNYIALFIIWILIFAVWQPVIAYMKAKRQIKSAEGQAALDFEFGTQEVKVSQGGQEIKFPWEKIVKIVVTRNMVIIYMDRIRAYLLPARVIGGDMGEFSRLVHKHLQEKQLKGI